LDPVATVEPVPESPEYPPAEQAEDDQAAAAMSDPKIKMEALEREEDMSVQGISAKKIDRARSNETAAALWLRRQLPT
jgi:hypothetical protein